MAPYISIWITEIVNKESIREKLGSKYGIEYAELEGHLICNRNLRGFDEDHPKHGLRTVVRVRMTEGKVIRVVIELIDEINFSWKIRTALYIK